LLACWNYYQSFTNVHNHDRDQNHYSDTERKSIITDTPAAGVNSAAGLGIIISNATNTKIHEKETGQNKTEHETQADFISGEETKHSHSYTSSSSSSSSSSNNKGGGSEKINHPEQGKSDIAGKRKTPRFFFGHSTGHSGSTSIHRALSNTGCPWHRLSHFEDKFVSRKEKNLWTVDYPECTKPRKYIVPLLIDRIQTKAVKYGRNTTYIDMGHFHNRGHTIECLADYFREDAAFVRIRRNRYDIAHSFSKNYQTPCMVHTTGLERHPVLSVCPRSNENAGSVNLPVSDKIWDALTPFQRFLWYADEMEHRWHTLKAMYQDGRHESRRPVFFEVTWSSSEQLTEEINKLRSTLGCNTTKISKTKRHVHHKKQTKLCALDIEQDFEYRRLMNYDDTTLHILVSGRFPQHVDSDECVESLEKLKNLTQLHAAEHGVPYDEDTWVFPLEEAEVT